ncbi:MAG: Stk1 family PASTA domain-containing Ser/Thr kinase [Clostridia bacterium]|nr:Stk1 family PASTA domain-containing Ser/Thr kinase [Clostridia bacterium]
MESYVGKTLGNRYEVREKLGEGGMAVVYKAYDPMENRVVAIKLLKEEFLENEEFSRRFKNESRAIAMLSHPNIVKVYDVYFSDKLMYIVMECIDGITLKDYIKQQKIVDWKEAVHFTTQILRALQHAHDKGIVHRDIKPQNIMVLKNGNIKVADFGIARFSRSETRTITENGAIGSVHYISPEQASGETTDAQADIYSVGIVLYEMITGRLPFDSASAVSVALMQVRAEPVRPRDINPMIPIGLEQITLKAMQKDKSVRYHTASEVLIDLDEFKRMPSIRFDYPLTTVPRNEGGAGSAGDVRLSAPYRRGTAEPIAPTRRTAAPAAVPERRDEDDEEEPAGKSAVLPVLIGVFSAMIVGLVILGIFVIRNKNKSKDFAMPELLGKKYEDVIAQYDYINFTDPIYVYSEQYADGYITDQSVAAGLKIKPTTAVTLSVASNKGTAVVNVVGYQYTEAQEILKSYGFRIRIESEKSATVREGTVLRTDPAADQIAQYGSTVVLFVATVDDSVPVIVPDLYGKTQEEAQAALEEVGLILGEVTEGFGTEENKGKIISQTPEKDSEIKYGSTVSVVISKGAEQEISFDTSVVLPNTGTTETIRVELNGKSVYEASVKLNGGAVDVTFTGKGSDNTFKVYLGSYELYAGTVDFRAEPPTLKVTKDNSAGYVSQKIVPDVKGLSLSNARKMLEKEGFKNISVIEKETDDYTPGSVISQTPEHSSEPVSPDTEITLVVAKSKQVVSTTATTAPTTTQPPEDDPLAELIDGEDRG